MTVFPHRLGREPRGFTLIELMIVVAIIGILVAVALPAYNQSVRKSRRADAKTALLDLAQREERYLSTVNVYTDQAPSLGYASTATVTVAAPMNVLSGSTAYYQMWVVLPTAPLPATSFTLTAQPISGTSQAADTCGTYTLLSTGAQSASGSSGGSDCW